VGRRLRSQQTNQHSRRERVEVNQLHQNGGIYPPESRQAVSSALQTGNLTPRPAGKTPQPHTPGTWAVTDFLTF
jgi:hypothetical protein